MTSAWDGTSVRVLNGPSLGRLGTREPEVYGSTTHDQLVQRCLAVGAQLGLDVRVDQTDAEHQMLGWLFEAADSGAAVVINPGGWSHTSVALRDAVACVPSVVVEVHISNIHAREQFRHHSYVSGVVTGVIAGLGVAGYDAALAYIAQTRTPSA